MTDHPSPSDDPAFAALLQQQWQAPVPDAMAAQKIIAAAHARPRHAVAAWRRWTLPGAAMAAAAVLLGLFVSLPRAAGPSGSVADVNEEAMMAYVFATYELEENL